MHPFLNGNGRMRRSILNSILLAHSGMAFDPGKHDDSRDGYIAI